MRSILLTGKGRHSFIANELISDSPRFESLLLENVCDTDPISPPVAEEAV